MRMQSFSEMNDQEFESIVDSYIERAADGYADVPSDVFFELFAERSLHNIDRTVNLSVDIVDNNINIHSEQTDRDVVIQGNEIWIGRHRLVFNLSGAGMPSPAFA